MRTVSSFAVILLLATACSGGDMMGGGAATVVERDSAGVAIREYSAAAISAAPTWTISETPMAVIGADENDATLDLSTGAFGGLLSDGGLIVATARPAQLYRFGPDGTRMPNLGRSGQGPGEFNFFQYVHVFPGDTVLAYELMRRKSILYLADGTFLSERDIPLPSDRQIPPLMRGRLRDGTFVHSGEALLPQAPGGPEKVFRMELPIFSLAPEATDYDTMLVTRSAQLYASSISAMGETMPMARPVAFGPTPLITVGDELTWVSTGDVGEMAAFRLGSRTPTQLVRFEMTPREVTEADRQRYKDEAREAFKQFEQMMPPGMLDSEIEKLEQTIFANEFPALGQLITDKTGRIWVGTGVAFGDTERTWMVLSPAGELIGRVTLPEGDLFAAASDRVVIRRTDDTTGMVRFEIWGLDGEQRTEN
jgi:hypothetical protein